MKITANQVTVARVVLMPIPGYLLYQEVPGLIAAIATITVLGFTDWLDGRMARKEGPTVLGGLLDPIADKIFLAICLIPLADRHMASWGTTALPLWMLIAMYCRDFLVTTLRTSLSLRGVPMRTSVLAKYKTAIQMSAVGYLLLLVITELTHPAGWTGRWIAIAAALLPLLYVLFRLTTPRKPGSRSITTASLTSIFAILFVFLSPGTMAFILMFCVTGLVVVSGFTYLTDATAALRGQPGGIKEGARFSLEGILMPTALLLPLHYYPDHLSSVFIIVGITMELAAGGLGNLLAEKKIAPRFRMIAAKSTLQVLFSGSAIFLAHAPGAPLPPQTGILCIAAAALVAVVFAAISFVRHRQVYLSQI